MISNTKHSLKKLETLLKELGYTVRYERGNFTSGYCIVEQRKVAIVNRFYDTESRINVLIDILLREDGLPVEERALTPASARLLQRVTRLVAAGEEEE